MNKVLEPCFAFNNVKLKCDINDEESITKAFSDMICRPKSNMDWYKDGQFIDEMLGMLEFDGVGIA